VAAQRGTAGGPGLVPSFQLSARAALAAGLSFAGAHASGLPLPFYALIAAVIVTDLEPARTRQLAVPRLLGTVVGAAIGAAGSTLLPPDALGAGIAAFAAMFATCLLRMENAARLAGYLAALVLIGYRDSAWSYGVYRLIETGIGIAAAVLLSFVPRLLRTRPHGTATVGETAAARGH
jgi:uncharacterized membrane protein YccC